MVYKAILNPAYRDLVDMAEHVDQEDGKIAYVQGDTLKKAIIRAISIYMAAHRLRGLVNS